MGTEEKLESSSCTDPLSHGMLWAGMSKNCPYLLPRTRARTRIRIRIRIRTRNPAYCPPASGASRRHGSNPCFFGVEGAGQVLNFEYGYEYEYEYTKMAKALLEIQDRGTNPDQIQI